MPANVLAVGLFAVTAAFSLVGLWFLKLKPFVDKERKSEIDRAFAVAIGAVGVYAFAAGFYIMAAEPYRAPFSEFFGLIHLYYGLGLLVGAVSLGRGWDLRPVSYLSLIGGIINMLYVYINETLIKNPTYPVIFVPAALVGLSAPFALHIKSVWASRVTGVLCLVLAIAALYLGLNAFVGHIARGLRA